AADEEGEDFALAESQLTGEEVLPLMPVSLWSDSDISRDGRTGGAVSRRRRRRRSRTELRRCCTNGAEHDRNGNAIGYRGKAIGNAICEDDRKQYDWNGALCGRRRRRHGRGRCGGGSVAQRRRRLCVLL
ncbi:hypothetical protein A2U01_0025474, partial [Trifolium medium]|nr:hypothetical protein [Trifolium medium]